MSDQPTFEVELTAMAHGGSALGRYQNRTVFIPYTIPGERVLARITSEKARVIFAEGVKLIEASADRVYPVCPHFGPGRCGRCHWQHIDYQAQLLLKQDVMSDQLARVGGLDDATIEQIIRPILASPEEWYYHHRITLQVTGAGDLGYPSASGEAVFLIQECHIIRPELVDLFTQFDFDVTGIDRLQLQLDSEGAHMIILHIQDEEQVPELQTDLTTSINVLLPEDEPINLVGDSSLRYTIGDRVFRVTAGCEFRSNLSQLPRLIEVVLGQLALTGTENVLDLYGGVGVFSAFIADQARRVTLIERYPPALTDAEINLAAYEHIDLIEGPIEDVLPELEDRYDAAILDPPAEGLSLAVLDQVKALKIPRLVYISADPATFARDAKKLIAHGYQLLQVQPIDLAPQTYEIHAVSLFKLG
ncbi:MAG: methyltransferase [Anaerolineae bacterium]|jgi:23S rRNA (uracil1939-C5)-methyltransferase|nr:methyltransferase [Anaerolineae bacterium]